MVAQMGRNLPAMQETWVQSLGWGDPWEKGMAAHSSILARKIPWTVEPGGLYVDHRVAKSQTPLSTAQQHIVGMGLISKICKELIQPQ